MLGTKELKRKNKEHIEPKSKQNKKAKSSHSQTSSVQDTVSELFSSFLISPDDKKNELIEKIKTIMNENNINLVKRKGLKNLIYNHPFGLCYAEYLGSGGYSRVFKVYNLEDENITPFALKIRKNYSEKYFYENKEHLQMLSTVLKKSYNILILKTIKNKFIAIEEELINGKNLHSYYNTRLSDNQKMKTVIESFRALAKLNAKKLTHVDIKPGNMMITNRMKLCLLKTQGDIRNYSIYDILNDHSSSEYILIKHENTDKNISFLFLKPHMQSFLDITNTLLKEQKGDTFELTSDDILDLKTKSEFRKETLYNLYLYFSEKYPIKFDTAISLIDFDNAVYIDQNKIAPSSRPCSFPFSTVDNLKIVYESYDVRLRKKMLSEIQLKEQMHEHIKELFIVFLFMKKCNKEKEKLISQKWIFKNPEELDEEISELDKKFDNAKKYLFTQFNKNFENDKLTTTGYQEDLYAMTLSALYALEERNRKLSQHIMLLNTKPLMHSKKNTMFNYLLTNARRNLHGQTAEKMCQDLIKIYNP